MSFAGLADLRPMGYRVPQPPPPWEQQLPPWQPPRDWAGRTASDEEREAYRIQCELEAHADMLDCFEREVLEDVRRIAGPYERADDGRFLIYTKGDG